jgi:hypothetical protein
MEITNVLDVAALLRQMASNREYHFPIVAAQRQFRDRYYGLSSAAMLEDLFYDAVAHFLSSNHPDCLMDRPPRGEKGWDYALNGFKVSHKVAKKVAQEIAVLWDATRTDITTYTYGSPISLTVSTYSPKKLSVTTSTGSKIRARPQSEVTGVRTGDHLVMIHWDEGGSASVLHHWTSVLDGPIVEAFIFRQVWLEVVRSINSGVPANHLECLVVDRKDSPPTIGSPVEMSPVSRPGTYLIPQDELCEIPVITNNRAVLIPKETVSELLARSVENSLFVPMPTWFSTYVGDRPPNLFLVQRNDFERFLTPGSAT